MLFIAPGYRRNGLPIRSSLKRLGAYIGGKTIDKKEVDKIALIAPNATVNIIKDYEVVRKFKVMVPEIIEGIVKCFNPNCVSSQYQNIISKLHVINKNPIKLQCHYCERIMNSKDIVLI